MTAFGPVLVAESSDDAVQATGGTVTINGTTINLNGNTNSYVGILIQNPGIPAAVTIDTSYLTVDVTTFSSGAEGLTVAIYGEKATSPATYAASGNNISGRTLTTAEVVWTFPGTNTTGSMNTPDLSTIVQEIVNQAGYVLNNPINFIINCSLGTNDKNFDIEAYDGSSVNCASLSGTYTGGGSVPTAPADLAVYLAPVLVFFKETPRDLSI